MKNFNIFGVRGKIWVLGGGRVHKKLTYRGDSLKRGLVQFADLRGGLARKRRVVFLRGGGLIPQCTRWSNMRRLA